MEENAVLQNDISFFFSFFPHYPFIQSYIIFQPTPLYSFTCSDKQAIYDEVQGYPGCGAVRDPSPFSYSPARSYSPTTTPRFTAAAVAPQCWSGLLLLLLPVLLRLLRFSKFSLTTTPRFNF